MPKKVPKNPSSRKLPTSNQGLQRDFIAAGTNIRAVDDDKENRTFDLSFSSEEPCQQWFGVEILDHDPAAVDMSRMQDVGVLLYNHNRDKVIGTILRAWIENGRGMATVKFDDDADSEIIRAKVASGTLKGVSVGYRVTNYESVKEGAKSLDGRFAGPCYVAKNGCPTRSALCQSPQTQRSVLAVNSARMARSLMLRNARHSHILRVASRQIKTTNRRYSMNKRALMQQKMQQSAGNPRSRPHCRPGHDRGRNPASLTRFRLRSRPCALKRKQKPKLSVRRRLKRPAPQNVSV